MGEKLWDTIWEAGKKFNISPGCPNLIDRIEGGLMSYGNDFTRENNPFECNLEKYCKDDVSHDFIGKQALTKIKNEGIKKNIGLSMILKEYWNVGESVFIQTLDGGKRNGTITSLPFPD